MFANNTATPISYEYEQFINRFVQIFSNGAITNPLFKKVIGNLNSFSNENNDKMAVASALQLKPENVVVKNNYGVVYCSIPRLSNTMRSKSPEALQVAKNLNGTCVFVHNIISL